MTGPRTELQGRQLARAPVHAVGDVVAGDHQVLASLVLAAQHDVAVRAPGVEVIGGDPVKAGAEVLLHRLHLQLHALAYNLANFLRTLATPELIERWSLTSLRERLIKTGVRLVRHARYAIFQMAEVALPRQVFAGILALINGLRGPPAGALSA